MKFGKNFTPLSHGFFLLIVSISARIGRARVLSIEDRARAAGGTTGPPCLGPRAPQSARGPAQPKAPVVMTSRG